MLECQQEKAVECTEHLSREGVRMCIVSMVHSVHSPEYIDDGPVCGMYQHRIAGSNVW